MFTIIKGQNEGAKLKFDASGLIIHSGSGPNQTIAWEQITELTALNTQEVKKTDTAVFGVLGAIVGGPIGAAAGASIGRLSREGTFVAKTDSGSIAFSGWVALFNQMNETYQLSKV